MPGWQDARTNTRTYTRTPTHVGTFHAGWLRSDQTVSPDKTDLCGTQVLLNKQESKNYHFIFKPNCYTHAYILYGS